MIGFSFDYGEGTVELLCKNRSHHLVIEGHGRKGDLSLRGGIHFRGKAVGSAYHETDVPGGMRKFAAHFFGEIQRTELFAVLVQKDYFGTTRSLEDEGSFALLYLAFAQGFRIFEFGDFLYLEGNVMLKARGIVVQALFYPGHYGFTDCYERYAHVPDKGTKLAQYLQNNRTS